VDTLPNTQLSVKILKARNKDYIYTHTELDNINISAGEFATFPVR